MTDFTIQFCVGVPCNLFLNNLVFRSTEETFSMADESYTSNPAMIGRKKIAIGVLFSLSEEEEAQRNFQDFFFSHFPLFESHINKLKSSIEKVIFVAQILVCIQLRFRQLIWLHIVT